MAKAKTTALVIRETGLAAQSRIQEHYADLDVRKRFDSWIPESKRTPTFCARMAIMFALSQLQKAAQDQERKEAGSWKPIAASIDTTIITFMMLGLMPNAALGYAYLVPFATKKGYQVITPVIGYKGLIRLCRGSGQVLEPRADVICDGDQFDIEHGRDGIITSHIPAAARNQRSFAKVKYAYSEVRCLSGGHEWMSRLLMSRGEIDDAKNHAAASNGPWKDWPIRMAQKTVLRRHCNSGQLPVDDGMGLIATADSMGEAGRISSLASLVSVNAPESADMAIMDAAAEDLEGMDHEREPEQRQLPQGGGPDIFDLIEAASTRDELRTIRSQCTTEDQKAEWNNAYGKLPDDGKRAGK